MDTKGYKYKETNLIWISLNVRLLHRKVCYLLSCLNRRVPNGTHGGVRGREITQISLLLDLVVFCGIAPNYAGAVLRPISAHS